MSDTRALVRPREPDDIPVLVAELLRQQDETRYPFRDPLPFPVEEFLHAHDAGQAWTAELDGRPVGQVCRMGVAHGSARADLLNDVAAQAHACRSQELAWVSALFVATHARGHGLGRRLLGEVVTAMLDAGLRPCLEVLPVHPAALSLYLATGWRDVHRFRPDWLREAAGEEGPDVHLLIHPSGVLT